MSNNPTPHRLILLGGGHSHIEVVRQFNSKTWPNTQLILISESDLTPYSGLLPAHIAGECSHADMHINLPRLCKKHGVQWLQAKAIGVLRSVQQLEFEHHPPLQYDTLSINIGATPNPSNIHCIGQCTTQHPAWVPVKPIHGLLQAWQNLQNLQASLQNTTQACAMAVVGGGAAGVELTLAMQKGLKHPKPELVQWHLFCAHELLPNHSAALQKHIRQILKQRHIAVHEHHRITTFQYGNPTHTLISVNAAQQKYWPMHTVFWAGPALAPSWLYHCGLAQQPGLGIKVHPTLQSTEDPRIFATGDACEFLSAESAHALPKAGVFAVRMGRILAHNLRYHKTPQHWLHYIPQQTWLSIVRTGPKEAAANKGRWCAHGRWIWHIKHSIDTRFMRRYQN